MPYLRYITHGQKTKTEAAMKFPLAALSVLVLVPVQSALAQESSWEKLMRLSPGSKIEVEDAHSGAIQGQLVSIDQQALTLRLKGKESGVVETIARAEVVRKPEGVVPVKANCGTKSSEKGDCHGAQE